MARFRGAYTALITPFRRPGAEIDWERFDALLDFQSEAGVRGVVVGGTTAESPTLTHEELERLFARSVERLPGRVETIAAVGKNDHRSTLALARAARDLGIRALMVVDPSYNAPSSLEIRREHLVPLARAVPDLDLLWYAIPARTGTCLGPVDLALARADAPNLAGLKDACGDDRYSREVRRQLPAPFAVLSGDDGRALAMIADPAIRADGLVSVLANVAPRPVVESVEAALSGAGSIPESGRRLFEGLGSFVSFPSEEATPLGAVTVKARNPVPVKALFALLGADMGGCRPPLGRLAPGAYARLAEAVGRVDGKDGLLSDPLQGRFGRPGPSAGDPAQHWSYDGY